MIVRVAMVAALLAVTGCTTTGLGDTKAGSIVSGLAGTQESSANGKVASTIISAMGGGLIGGPIGGALDDRERRQALEAEYRTLEYTQSGQPVSWKSEQSGRGGQVVAGQPYRVGSQDCRQYTHTIFSGGQSRSARGTACRNADGSWTPLT
jgi:surface antigen